MERPAMVPSGNGTFAHARTTGHDHWLNDRLLLGSSLGWSQGNLQFNRSGGSARSQSPQWNLYLHGNGDNGWYAMGDLGYGRHQLNLDRTIDLGDAERHVSSERKLETLHAYAEAGLGIDFGGGRLTPFAAVAYATSASDGFIEKGSTGFELIGTPSHHQRSTSHAGLRYVRDWRWGGDRWMQLGFGAHYQYLLDESDDMRAAFTGTPEVGFHLGALPTARSERWVEMNLAGGSGTRWSWLLSYDNRASTKAVSLGVELGF
jgi:outer membrane autotransporter protein